MEGKGDGRGEGRGKKESHHHMEGDSRGGSWILPTSVCQGMVEGKEWGRAGRGGF